MTPAQRITRIYGRGGLARFATALGVNPSTVSLWNRDGWPQYALVVLEWLEETPEKYWPERWERS